MEFANGDQFFVRRTFSGLRGVKVPQFSLFCQLSHTKRLKSPFLCAAYSPGVTLQNASAYSTVVMSDVGADVSQFAQRFANGKCK